jgi:hypothetical protein
MESAAEEEQAETVVQVLLNKEETAGQVELTSLVH